MLYKYITILFRKMQEYLINIKGIFCKVFLMYQNNFVLLNTFFDTSKKLFSKKRKIALSFRYYFSISLIHVILD